MGRSATNIFHDDCQLYGFICTVRRPIPQTYTYITEKLGDSELSIRKQVCVQFLMWMCTVSKKDRAAFVDLIKRWRKEEDRIGQPRSLLERKARKLFGRVEKDRQAEIARENRRKAAKITGQRALEQKTGIHAPEFAEQNRISREEGAFKKQQKSPKHPHLTYWKVFPPDGEAFITDNLTATCKKYGLDFRNMIKTSRQPHGRKHHKGWRVEKCNTEWDNL